MNLNDILPQEQLETPSTLHLVHPIHGDELFHGDEPVTITIYGTESELAKSTMKKRAQREMNSRAKRNIDEAIEFNTSFLAKLITDWTGVYDNDAPIEFSRENAIMILKKYAWIREQVDQFVSERANFIKS